MKTILLIFAFYGPGGFNGGAAAVTQRVEFNTEAACTTAAKEINGFALRLNRDSTASFVALCITQEK